MRRLLAALTLTAFAIGAPAQARSPYADWAAIVVAGDDHASHTDDLTETFDNARRDVAKALVRKGFSPANIAQFSMRPARYPDTHPALADVGPIRQGLRALTARPPAGCLIYFTSHGDPDGLALDDYLLAPRDLARLIQTRCDTRPTVVVISACFSGVFIPALKAPDRLILTAARRDRSSFGCGESDVYPFFDACILEVLPASPDFIALGPRARACVDRREREEGMSPPSEPQTWIGPTFRAGSQPFAN